MMLYKLSLSNIKKSFKDYAIYFTTLILGVCIFYLFNSMDSQTAMLEVSKRQANVIKLLIQALSYVSVFVSFVLGFLIIYASRFLMKKRNKEFAIYMTLGMSKRKISFMLLIETFIIGLISLVVGLLLGVFISQITSVFVANMFEADMTKYTFNYSADATIKTIIYFGIIYFIVMIFNTIVINKNKLINLLQASKKGEKIRLKNPIVCIILFIISIIMLASAYYMVTGGLNDLLKHEIGILLVPISLGAVGTVLFFYSFSGMLLKALHSNQNLYYKKLNSFIFKQINSKINTMVVSISVICILLFMTFCLLSSALTVKNYFDNSIKKYAPIDFQLIATYNDEDFIDVRSFVDNDSFIKKNTKDVMTITVYFDKNLTFASSLGKLEQKYRDNYKFIIYNTKVEIVSLSDYNKMASLYDFKKLDLKKDQYAVVSNYQKELYKEVVNANSIIPVYGHNLKPYGEVIDGFITIGGNPTNGGFFVIDDSLIDSSNQNKLHEVLFGNYNTKDENIVEKLEDKIENYKPDYILSRESKIAIKENAAGLSSMVTFIGLYLGIIFLISSTAILALKELSDCIDDRNKYKVLRELGVDEKDINKALYKQTFIFFMLPLSLALVHTIFGMKFCTFVLSSLGIDSILSGAILTLVFLVIIYGIYFIVTYQCNKNIIKERI